MSLYVFTIQATNEPQSPAVVLFNSIPYDRAKFVKAVLRTINDLPSPIMLNAYIFTNDMNQFPIGDDLRDVLEALKDKTAGITAMSPNSACLYSFQRINMITNEELN